MLLVNRKAHIVCSIVRGTDFGYVVEYCSSSLNLQKISVTPTGPLGIYISYIYVLC